MTKQELIEGLQVVVEELEDSNWHSAVELITEAIEVLETTTEDTKSATVLQEINSFSMTDKDVWLDYVRMFVHKDLEMNEGYHIRESLSRADYILEQMNDRFYENGKSRKEQ